MPSVGGEHNKGRGAAAGAMCVVRGSQGPMQGTRGLEVVRSQCSGGASSCPALGTRAPRDCSHHACMDTSSAAGARGSPRPPGCRGPACHPSAPDTGPKPPRPRHTLASQLRRGLSMATRGAGGKVACREETYAVHWKGAGIGHPNRQVCTAPVRADERSGAPRASQANEGLWASVTGCGERRRGKAHRVPLSRPRSLTSESGRPELPTLDLTLGAQRP